MSPLITAPAEMAELPRRGQLDSLRRAALALIGDPRQAVRLRSLSE